MNQALFVFFSVLVSLGVLGCARITAQVVEKPRVDQELSGNRGYLAGSAPASPLEAVIARVLLVHEFRRVALRDPMLPPALYPAAWPGSEARRLVSAIYNRLLADSEAWLDRNATTRSGALPTPDRDLARRFAA